MTRFPRRHALVALAAATMAIGLAAPAQAQKKLTLGFAQVGAESEWRTANTAS
jgi:ABC-type sugar transport system substrate-binding protein